MSKEKMILVGGGGHCKSVIDVIESENKYEIAGIVDLKEKIGQSLLGYKIIAGDDDLEKLSDQYKFFLVTIGQIKSSQLRVKMYEMLKSNNVKIPSIISPFAKVSKFSDIGEGTVVMHMSMVNAGAVIGVNCIINTSSIIEHDAIIGNHCHISTSAVINGNCKIGSHSFIGSNAVLSNGIVINENNIIGAGSVVLKDTESNGVYVGNPAILKKNNYE